MRRLGLVLLALTLTPLCVRAQDDKFSQTLLEEARGGNARAQNDLAIAYSEGIGVKPNQRKAVYWFRKSAEQGYAYGMCNLGTHYGQGIGVRRDRVQALKWSFAANSLDGLRCHPGDFIQALKIKQCDVEEAWGLAVEWLRAHPNLENRNFGGRPWMKDEGEYGVTVRERGPRVELPVKPSGTCKRKSKAKRGPQPDSPLQPGPAHARGKNWRAYSPTRGGFSVETPAPLRKVMSFDADHGASLEPDQKEAYVASYAAIETTPQDSRFGVVVINTRGKPLPSGERESGLEYLAAYLIGNDDETQFMRTPVAVVRNGLTGKEYFYVDTYGGDLFARGRIFDTGDKIFVIVFVGKDEKDLTSSDAERFLNSFRLRGRTPRT